jgi:hypothetical protein
MRRTSSSALFLVFSILLVAGPARSGLAQLLWSSHVQPSWHWGGAATTAQSYASGSWEGNSFLRVRINNCTEQDGGLAVDFPSQYTATGRRHAGFICRIGPRFTDCRPRMKMWWLQIHNSAGEYQHRRGILISGGWHDSGHRMLPTIGFGGTFWPANDEFGNQYLDAPENNYTWDYDDYENEWLYVEFGYVTGGTMTLSIWNRSGTLAHNPHLHVYETDHGNTDDVTQPGDYAHGIRLSAYVHSATGADADSYVDYSDLYFGSSAMGPPPGFLTTGSPTIAISSPTSASTYSTTASTVNLAGTAGGGAGTIVSVTWANSRGGSGTASGTSAWSANGIALQTGANTITLTVQNSGGDTGTDVIVVTRVQNQAPSADAGANRSVTAPTSVLLNGTGSDGPDDAPSPLSYSWQQIGGPTVTLFSSTTAQPSFNASTEGVYVFRLTVSDGELTDTDDVTITAVPAAVNLPPAADAGPDREVAAGATVILDGADSIDSDGTITAYLWEQISGPSITLANGNTSIASVASIPAGAYVFRLTVTDNQAATGADQVTVTAIAPPPATNDDPIDDPIDDPDDGTNEIVTGLAVRPNVFAPGDTDGSRVVGSVSLANETVRIYEVSGELVGEIEMTSAGTFAEGHLNADWKLPAGVYFVMAAADGTIYRARFVVRP